MKFQKIEMTSKEEETAFRTAVVEGLDDIVGALQPLRELNDTLKSFLALKLEGL